MPTAKIPSPVNCSNSLTANGCRPVLIGNRGHPLACGPLLGRSIAVVTTDLATLRKFYPDAQMFGDGNFIFTENGKRKLYNPNGIDVGDLAEYGRIIPEMIGGAAGGIAGMAASTPTGMTSAPVMVPVGVGLGAETAGQAYDTALEQLFGESIRAALEGALSILRPASRSTRQDRRRLPR